MPAKKTIIFILSICTIIITQGCESHAEKKQAAVLRWQKATAEVKLPVAKDLYESGRIEEAETTILQCLNVSPEIAEAHLLKAQIELAQGKFDKAKDSLTTAVELDDKLHKAWHCFGVIAQYNQQYNIAEDHFMAALHLEPTNTEYITSAAQLYVYSGDEIKALDLLNEKINIIPDNTALRIQAAEILSSMGRADQAVIMYRKTLLQKPNDLNILESLGYCYISQKQWQDAAETFEMLYLLLPEENKNACLKTLATCSMNAGRYSEAYDCYDKLSAADRDNPEVWFRMGQAALGASAPKRALTCAQKALELKPQWPDAIALKGSIQYVNADYKNALETFRQITGNTQFKGLAWLMVGRCYQQIGRLYEADLAFEKAAGFNPESQLLTLLTDSENSNTDL